MAFFIPSEVEMPAKSCQSPGSIFFKPCFAEKKSPPSVDKKFVQLRLDIAKPSGLKDEVYLPDFSNQCNRTSPLSLALFLPASRLKNKVKTKTLKNKPILQSPAVLFALLNNHKRMFG